MNTLQTLASALVLAGAASAQDGGRVPVRIVEGRLVVACDVSSPARRIPVNLFIEYETACGVQLHNKAAFPLRIESSDGQTTPFRIHFPDFAITVEKREHGDEEYLDDFTKYHSVELGENAVVGVIGAEILANYHVTFDLAEGYIELQPPHARTEEPPEELEGTSIVPLTVHNGMAWLPVRYEDGLPAAMGIGTARYDTTVDELVCEELGHPAGDIGRLRIGDVDVSQFVAMRPEEVILVHPDGVAGVMGLGFLRHFRVAVDRVNRTARLTQTASADFPEEDLAYFKAMIAEEPDGLEAYLEANPGERLNLEAAKLLLNLRLDEDANDDAVARAIHWIEDTTIEDLRATRMLDLMEELSGAGYPNFVVTAGERGIESGRDDRYPNAVHEIHAKMGDVLLKGGENRRAWKHLLSAAFGIPEDGLVNLNLGRYYEGEGRFKRAYSRYIQACIKPESGPQAIEALERVQKELPDEDTFSVDLVDKLVGGKVRSFGAATKFKADDENFAGRVALVEFFTNANFGNGDRGAIGGALGNQGLVGHFPSENVAFLAYHLREPSLEPLVNEVSETTATLLGLDGPYYHLVNGVHRGPGSARWRKGEEVYDACRRMVLSELAKPSDYTLELDSRIEGGELAGTLVVSGPENESLSVYIVLAEAGVLFPGKSEVVVHRMVARAALTETPRGVDWAPVDGRMQVDFKQSLADVAAANAAYLDKLEADGKGATMRMSLKIDPAQVRVIAFVREPFSAEVLQAIQVEPERPEDDPR